MPVVVKSMLRIVIAIAVAVIVLWMFRPLIERRLVFFPSREWDLDPVEFGLEARELTFQAADGTRLSGLWLEAPQALGVVVYAHGNAGNLSHRIPMAEVWRRKLQLSVLLFDYRGYGRSQGVPDEKGILQDALAAYDQALRLGGEIPLVAGRSLGTVPAIQVAAQREVRGLLLDSPMASAARMAPRVLPLPGIRHLISVQLDNVGNIGRVGCPVLILHGELDRIIPIEQGKEVYNAAAEATFVVLDGVGHNEPRTTPEILNHFRNFVAGLDRTFRD
jgi:hypothetical protein